MVYIATQSLENKRVKLGDISNHTGSPEAFTSKILGLLSKNQLIQSIKGPNGGFEMDSNSIKNISLSQVVYAIDGDDIYRACSMGMPECNDERPCLLHHKYVKVRGEIKRMLETTTIYHLAKELNDGNVNLLIPEIPFNN